MVIESKEGRRSELGGLIDDEVLDEFAIVAPPEEVPDRLARRGAARSTACSSRSRRLPHCSRRLRSDRHRLATKGERG